MENIEIALKLLAVIVSVVATYKAVVNGWFHRRPKLREDYEFSKKFIDEVVTKENSHPFTIEKGFLAVMGRRLNADIIMHLFTFSNPALAFNSFYGANYLLELDKEQDILVYRDKYLSDKKRKRSRIWKYVGYWVYSIFALTPFFFADKIVTYAGLPGLGLVGFCLIGFGSVSIFFLKEIAGFNQAKELLKQEIIRKSKENENHNIRGDKNDE